MPQRAWIVVVDQVRYRVDLTHSSLYPGRLKIRVNGLLVADARHTGRQESAFPVLLGKDKWQLDVVWIGTRFKPYEYELSPVVPKAVPEPIEVVYQRNLRFWKLGAAIGVAWMAPLAIWIEAPIPWAFMLLVWLGAVGYLGYEGWLWWKSRKENHESLKNP